MESPADDDDEELLAILKEAREAANQAFESFFSCHNNNNNNNTSPAPAPAAAAAAPAAALPDQNDVGGSGVVPMVVRCTKMYPPTLLCGMHNASAFYSL